MNRPTLQTILCLALCPLLPAQQIAQPAAPTPQRYITLPSGTAIELVPPGQTRFSKAKPGVLLQLVLDRDIVLDGKPVIHAAVPVAGVVESAKGKSHLKHRPAELNIRVTEIIAGQPTDLHIRCFDPDDAPAQAYDEDRPHPGFGPLKWVPLIVGGLVLLALLGGDR